MCNHWCIGCSSISRHVLVHLLSRLVVGDLVLQSFCSLRGVRCSSISTHVVDVSVVVASVSESHPVTGGSIIVV